MAAPFNGSPISTKFSTPIYSVCAPPTVATANPCALTTGTAPNKSTGVKALVRDAYGNAILPQTVTLTSNSTVTTLGSDQTDANGFAEFADTLATIPGVGDYTVTATVTTGPTSPTPATAPLAIVNELAACDNTFCKNNTSNGDNTRPQKAYGQITTAPTGDFFNGTTTNVRLSTQFVAGSQTNQCGNSTIGQATDLRAAGPGVGATAPATTMVIVMPKDTLKGYGITSRGTASFEVCLGVLNIDPNSTQKTWQQKNGKKGLKASSDRTLPSSAEGRAWGVPADCGTAGLTASDPCIALRTKQAADTRAYLGMTTTQFAELGIKDADLVIIIRKGAPWDGKGGVY